MKARVEGGERGDRSAKAQENKFILRDGGTQTADSKYPFQSGVILLLDRGQKMQSIHNQMRLAEFEKGPFRVRELGSTGKKAG